MTTACLTTKCTVQLSPQPLGSNTCIGLVMADFVASYQYMIPDFNAVLFVCLYSQVQVICTKNWLP